MATKIHPHLKAFIRGIVMAEMIGPSESYKFREQLMREVQTRVLDKLNEIKTKEDMDKIIEENTEQLKEEMNRILDMIGGALKNVPLDILKRVK